MESSRAKLSVQDLTQEQHILPNRKEATTIYCYVIIRCFLLISLQVDDCCIRLETGK